MLHGFTVSSVTLHNLYRQLTIIFSPFRIIFAFNRFNYSSCQTRQSGYSLLEILYSLNSVIQRFRFVI